VWKKIARVAKVVQNLAIIGGIFVGVGSLVFGLFAKRVEAVGEFRKEYVDKIRNDFLELVSRWSAPDYGPKFLTAKKEDGKNIILNFYNDSTNQKSLLNVADFFDGLWFCVQTTRCDQNTSLDLFQTQADAIYEMSAYYIDKKRQQDRDPNFGQGLEKFYRLKPQSYLARFFVIPQL
jgi:hypothetical protein